MRTVTKTKIVPPGTNTLVRHIVKLDDKGNPEDECLCGHLWDRVHVQQGKDICQKCVDLMRKQGRAR